MSAHPEPKPAASLDPVWDRVRREAKEIVANEPLMASLAHAVILQARSLETAISYRLAQKL
ncbi:MAG: serine O-acetyltransferase, partial [Pseudomonadota bacterium]